MITSNYLRPFALVCCVAAVGFIQTTSALADESKWQRVRDTGSLRCGAAIAAPYVMRNPRSNEYSGFFVEMCQKFAEYLGVEARFVDTNWDNIVAGAQSGRWDLAMALNETPERARAVAFSAPVSQYEVSFLYHQRNSKIGDGAKTLADIDQKNITIAVMSGSVADKAVTDNARNATIMRLPGMDETRLAVMSRRADILADANDTNMLFHLANEKWAAVMTPAPPLAPQGVAFGMNLSTPEADIEELNVFINNMRESGEIDRLIHEATRLAVQQAH